MYNKYKKIKISPDAKNQDPNKSIKNVSKYINDKDKTVFSTQAAFDYISNEAKTYEQQRNIRLVSGYNCDPESCVKEFEIARNNYYAVKDEHLNQGQTPVQAYHLISSFKGKVDPELAHKIGLEFCQILLGDSFQAVVSTHLNTQNTHNHILINAFALDGAYKFKDEYHLYRKLREISDSLSLKYGIELYMGDEQTKQSYKYKSWADVLDDDKEVKKTAKSQFISDIKQAISVSSDYPSFIQNMQSNGYQCTINKASTTFKKEGYSFRDTSLGAAYKKDTLEAKWAENKQREEALNKLKQLKRENAAKYKKYDTVLVPKWDNLGNRLGILKRFLLMVKNLLEQIYDDYYSPELEELYPSNINFQPAFKKLANINRAIELLNNYHIKTDEGLSAALKEAGAALTLSRSEMDSITDFLANASELSEQLSQLKDLESKLSEAGFDISSIPLSIPSPDEIKASLASLEPMTPKTKSRLYQKLHSSPDYRLALPFNSITNTEAKEILSFLNAPTTNPKPSLLLTKEEYNILCAKRDLQSRMKELLQKNKTAPLFLQPQNLSNNTQNLPSFAQAQINSTIKNQFTLISPNPTNPFQNKPHRACYSRAYKASSDQFKMICQLKRAYPDDFQHVNPSLISAKDAQKVINHGLYLIQSDPSLSHPDNSNSTAPFFEFSSYSPELQTLIKEYRLLKNYALEYGLSSTSDIDSFLAYQQDKRIELQKCKDDFDNATAKYKDLKFIQRTISDSSKTAFVYGAAYPGTAEELKTSKENLGNSKLDSLFETYHKLKDTLTSIDFSTLSKAPIHSTHFVPPAPEIKETLLNIKSLFPDSYKDINVNTMSEYDALSLIKSIIEQQEIELEMKKLLEQEGKLQSEETKKQDKEAFETFLQNQSEK